MNELTGQLIAQYARGGETLSALVRDVSPQTMLCEPPADAGPEIGKWTIHEVIVHLADAELSFTDRFKRLIAMENPALLAWDENQFMSKLFYKDQSAADAVALIELLRRQMTRVLSKLPESAFERAGTHSERGRQTLNDVLGFAVWHLDHHLKFIEAKKSAFSGKSNA